MEKNKGTADGRFGELTLPYVEVNTETKKFKEYPPPPVRPKNRVTIYAILTG